MESSALYISDLEGQFENITEECTYIWIVENFSKYRRDVGYVLISPEFNIEKNKMCTWKLNLYPTGWGTKTNDYIGLFLRLITAPSLKNLTQFTLSIMDANNRIICSRSHRCLVEKNPRYGFTKFGKREIIISQLPNDIMKIHAHIFCVFDKLQCSHSKLVEDLYAMFCSRKHCDVVFSVGRQKLKAHKNILTARSPVFEAMFNYNFIENQTSEVIITDFCADTISNLLLYIYTDKVKNNNNIQSIIDLLRAAEKYNVDNLKLKCCKFLLSVMDKDNVSDIFFVAVQYNISKLKAKVMDFMFANLSKPKRRECLQKIETEYPKLAHEISSCFQNKL